MNSLEIVSYSPDLRDYFKILNLEWIEELFMVLPTDEYILNNPEEAILQKGGAIYFVKVSGEIAGTVALIRVDANTLELAKMAVSKKFRNYGIGKKLLNYTIQKARQTGAGRLILYTNTRLTVALSLYSKAGFSIIPKTDFHNERANIKMEMIL